MIFQFEIIIASIIVGIIYLIIFVVGISKATSKWVKNYRLLGLLPVSLILIGIGAFFLFSIARIISIGSVVFSFGLVLLITSLVGAIVDHRNQIKKAGPKKIIRI